MDRLTHTALISRRNLLKAGGGALAAATVAPHLGTGTATAQTPKRGGTLSLRLWDPPHFDPHLTISYKINMLVHLHPQPAAQAQGRAGRDAGHLPDRGRSRRVVDPAERDDLHLQAQEGRALAQQAAGERARAHGGRREVHLRPLRLREGQRQSRDDGRARQGRGGRQVHGQVHAEGAIRLVPRHGLEPDGARDHPQGGRREVRRPEEGRVGRSAPGRGCSKLPAERRRHLRPEPDLLRARAAVHRQGRGHDRRGQRLPDGGLHRGQVRPRL